MYFSEERKKSVNQTVYRANVSLYIVTRELKTEIHRDKGICVSATWEICKD